MSEEIKTESQGPRRWVVVVAEDSAPNRKILVTLLSKMGFTVEEFADGEDAWKFLSGNSTDEIALVVTDYMMPKMNGLELMEKMRGMDRYKTTHVVISSAINDKDVILKAKSLNVSGYLLKPVRSDGLLKRLMELFPAHSGLLAFQKRDASWTRKIG